MATMIPETMTTSIRKRKSGVKPVNPLNCRTAMKCFVPLGTRRKHLRNWHLAEPLHRESHQLIDRGEREIPIQADIVAEFMELDPGCHIKLEGPDPLKLVIRDLERDGE